MAAYQVSCSQRVAVLFVFDGPEVSCSLGHSHLLYIPDRWQGVHSLRRVHRVVDV